LYQAGGPDSQILPALHKSTGDGGTLEEYSEGVHDNPILYSQTIGRTEASCDFSGNKAVDSIVFSLRPDSVQEGVRALIAIERS